MKTIKTEPPTPIMAEKAQKPMLQFVQVECVDCDAKQTAKVGVRLRSVAIGEIHGQHAEYVGVLQVMSMELPDGWQRYELPVSTECFRCLTHARSYADRNHHARQIGRDEMVLYSIFKADRDALDRVTAVLVVPGNVSVGTHIDDYRKGVKQCYELERGKLIPEQRDSLDKEMLEALDPQGDLATIKHLLSIANGRVLDAAGEVLIVKRGVRETDEAYRPRLIEAFEAQLAAFGVSAGKRLSSKLAAAMSKWHQPTKKPLPQMDVPNKVREAVGRMLDGISGPGIPPEHLQTYGTHPEDPRTLGAQEASQSPETAQPPTEVGDGPQAGSRRQEPTKEALLARVLELQGKIIRLAGRLGVTDEELQNGTTDDLIETKLVQIEHEAAKLSADRDEWKTQHENLLALRDAEQARAEEWRQVALGAASKLQYVWTSESTPRPSEVAERIENGFARISEATAALTQQLSDAEAFQESVYMNASAAIMWEVHGSKPTLEAVKRVFSALLQAYTDPNRASTAGPEDVPAEDDPLDPIQRADGVMLDAIWEAVESMTSHDVYMLSMRAKSTTRYILNAVAQCMEKHEAIDNSEGLAEWAEQLAEKYDRIS